MSNKFLRDGDHGYRKIWITYETKKKSGHFCCGGERKIKVLLWVIGQVENSEITKATEITEKVL